MPPSSFTCVPHTVPSKRARCGLPGQPDNWELRLQRKKKDAMPEDNDKHIKRQRLNKKNSKLPFIADSLALTVPSWGLFYENPWWLSSVKTLHALISETLIIFSSLLSLNKHMDSKVLEVLSPLLRKGYVKAKLPQADICFITAMYVFCPKMYQNTWSVAFPKE